MPLSTEDERVGAVMREMLAACADSAPPVSAAELHRRARNSLTARVDTKVVLALAAVIILVVALLAAGPLRRTSGSTPAATTHHTGVHTEFSVRPVLCYAPPLSTHSEPVAQAPLTCGAAYALTAARINVEPGNANVPAGYANAYVSNALSPPDPAFTDSPSTPPSADRPSSSVLLPGNRSLGPNRYVLGPAALVGADVRSATVVHRNEQWIITVDLTGTGSPALDTLAHQQFHAFIAFDLDGAVVSAPLVQPTQSSFTSFGGTLDVSGPFTHAGATALARQINEAR
jgi:hypothetical protein